MQVFKFGGSCLTGPESLERVRAIVEQAGPPAVCVFSALKGVTDRLIALAGEARRGGADPEPLLAEHYVYLDGLDEARRRRAVLGLDELSDELRRSLKGIELLEEASPRVLDRVMSFGERAACVLAEALLGRAGLPVRAVPDADPGLLSDGVHGDARILPASVETVRARYADRAVVHIVPGFVARGPDGRITTLGRGGSDYSATWIGSALGVTTVLWKDTAGLLTSNPHIVKDPRLIERVHYLDALELAHYGTEAIADKAILPPMDAGTAVEIRSIADPRSGTRIEGGEADVLAITCVRRAVMVDFLGLRGSMLRTLSHLFDALADMQTYPLLVTEASPRGETSMVLKEGDLPRFERFLSESPLDEPPEIRRELGVVSCVGSHMRGRVGMAAAIFECLATHGINVVAIAQTASERNVSVTLERHAVEPAVRALHGRFIGEPRAA